MKITPKHTYTVILLNALSIIITIITTAANRSAIIVSDIIYKTLSYVSAITTLYILLYLLFAFKYFDNKKRFVGFGLFIAVTAALPFLMPHNPSLIKTRWGVAFAVLGILLFINICYLTIISLKITYRPLAIAYFVFFLSLIIVILLPMVMPLILVYLERQPDGYLYIMHFVTFVPPLMRFVVLYQINMGLKHLDGKERESIYI
nr:hypothetical protein [uncultured Mucilaginibacter sp.]